MYLSLTVRGFEHYVTVALFIFWAEADHIDTAQFVPQAALRVRQTARFKVSAVCFYDTPALLLRTVSHSVRVPVSTWAGDAYRVGW